MIPRMNGADSGEAKVRLRLRLPLLGWLLLALVSKSLSSPAQAPVARLNIAGRPYELFQIDTRAGALRIKALGNRRTVETLFGPESTATAAGVIGPDELGYAAAYDPAGGLALLNAEAGAETYSIATGVSDDGTIVGYEFRYSGPTRLPSRAFRYTKAEKLQYLDVLYPAVRQLAERRFSPDDPAVTGLAETRALFVNGPGTVYLQSPLINDPGYYLLDPQGKLARARELGAVRSGLVAYEVPWFNASGEFPPESSGSGALALANTVVNDVGDFAGPYYATNNLTRILGAHRDGTALSGTGEAIPTAINNRGDVAAFPGLFWDSLGTRVDLRQVLWAEGRTTFLKNAAASFTNGAAPALVNDAGDLAWNTFYFRRVCPEVSLRAELVEGFTFAAGKLAVKAGGRFKARAILSNPTAEAFGSVRVELYPPSPLFRQIGESVPPLPLNLPAGAEVQAVFEWEALQSGTYEGALAFFGEGPCGASQLVLPAATIEFQDSPLGVGFQIEAEGQVTNQVALCSEFVLVASVTNLTSGVLTNVAPLAPPTNNALGRFVVVQALPPSSPLTLAARATGQFRWKARAARLGPAEVLGVFAGTASGIPFRVGPARAESLEVLRSDFVVNRTGDEPNADATEICPDVDPQEPGAQVTLRAAIQSANLLAGPDVIRFDLPTKTPPEITPASPLPPVTNECRILGNTQPGGWVGVLGSRVEGDADTAGLEFRAAGEIRGFAFTRFSAATALRLSQGETTVRGCRFGINVRGEPAAANVGNIRVTTSGATIGGTGANDGNRFLGGELGILVETPAGKPRVERVVIEGNVFGNLEGPSGFHGSGPGNAVIFVNTRACRLGGLTLAARNYVLGSARASVALVGPDCSENTVLGNAFGLRRDGTVVGLGDFNRYGIALIQGAHHNRIGGVVDGSRNLISGCNDAGVATSLGAHDNVIEGNWIGLTGDGLGEAGNGIGVWLLAGANNRVGGSTPASRNIISGNLGAGIMVGRPSNTKFTTPSEDPKDEPSFGARLEGNWVGLDATGARARPNGRDFRSDGVGIEIQKFAAEVILGGTSVGQRNVVSGNQGPGIRFAGDDDTRVALWGNYVGVSSDGSHGVANQGPGLVITGNPAFVIGGAQPWETNRIAFNAGPGVDLQALKAGARPVVLAGNLLHDNSARGSIALAARRTASDPGDADSGPNGLQNWPLILGAYNRDGLTRVAVDLSSFKRDVVVRLDVFRAAGGGGDVWLAATNVVTGQAPKDRWLLSVPLVLVGSQLTLLATTLEGTSEFSPIAPVYSGVDSDGDGIPDALERGNRARATASLANAATGDVNADGVPDAEQASVVSVQLTGQDSWITLAVPTGQRLTDVVALSPTDLPRGFAGQTVFPGALRFTREVAAAAAEPAQLWFEGRSPTPALWWSDGVTWTPLRNVSWQAQGNLTRGTLTLPATGAGAAGWIAITEPTPARPAPAITVWGPELRSLGREVTREVGGLSDVPGVDDGAFLARLGWVVPVDIAWPDDGRALRLETSVDLSWWEEVPAWPNLETGLGSLSWPAEDRARFFRWQPE